ncbi:hypothetical protein KFK09_009832 [Dendrobium nobile]|uniref:Retrovirus-related Pol polyprotein from transposon TNT 1-94 n=1 Tax=Dendrobium nobile TaxID=94219 RepID=A0A8T3BKG5_DENNO|nr:hypothetical protein KFK09_009832 [Dendrobium nobile]
MASSNTSSLLDRTGTTSSETPAISSSLKFVLSNLKNFVQSPLSADNYPLLRSQIVKICRANGFESFLDPQTLIANKFFSKPNGSTAPNPSHMQWLLTDQNLSAAICSTISSSILPYILNLESTSLIWTTLETRFQSTSRSKAIQLKNELHNISLKNSSMSQYLTEVKNLVDQIATA